MDNLVSETNKRIQEIIDNLETIKNEYETKLKKNTKEIDKELEQVKKYKEDFFSSKQKIEKMNSDIEGFEEDYQKLVERFKDDELANILIAANKEISAKIEERKIKIIQDKKSMNELVEKAELVKEKLVRLTSEKKALEVCLTKILDSYNYYTKALNDIITYSNEHKNNLSNDSKLFEDEEYNESTLQDNIDLNEVNEVLSQIGSEDFVSEEIVEETEDVNEDTDDTDENPEFIDEEINNDAKEETEESTPIKEEDKEDKLEEEINLDFDEEIDLSNLINFDDTLEDEEFKEDE